MQPFSIPYFSIFVFAEKQLCLKFCVVDFFFCFLVNDKHSMYTDCKTDRTEVLIHHLQLGDFFTDIRTEERSASSVLLPFISVSISIGINAVPDV